MVNIVTEPKPYWILGYWAEEFQKRIPDSRIVEKPIKNEVNLYINYALYEGKTKLDIGVFTHLEKDKESKGYKKWIEASQEMDWCFSQSKLFLKDLPQRRSSQISIGVNEIFRKNLIIGIVGRKYDSGRKNYELVDKLKIEGIEYKIADGQYSREQMPDFYRSIDYLLIIATNEGGPMPLLEAMSMGKPVIAPRGVGWCDEFPTLKYENEDELRRLLDSLVTKDCWDIGAKQIIDKINELLNV